jgi:hypothetical protein
MVFAGQNSPDTYGRMISWADDPIERSCTFDGFPSELVNIGNGPTNDKLTQMKNCYSFMF